MLAVLALLLGITLASEEWKSEVNRNFDDLDHYDNFLSWKEAFGKEYDNEQEEQHRFLLFVDNWRMINEHNMESHNYTMGNNQFSDLTQTEFWYEVHGHAESCIRKRDDAIYKQLPGEPQDTISAAAPSSIDWTNVNGSSYVTPVKNQGNCGSCWAFSTVGSLESFAAIKNGWTGSEIVELSEQQLVDCTYSVPDGCQGGLQEDGFTYIAKEGGLCTEAEYPYTARDGSCKASACGKKYDTISSYKSVTKNNEQALVNALAVGPIAVSVDAAGPGWTYYKSGVYSGECGVSLDHGVVGVGYGTDSKQGDYWKIKNSWGKTWGMEGYMLICRNCDKNGNRGECGILEDNTYPVF